MIFGQLSWPCEPKVWGEVERLLRPSLRRSDDELDEVTTQLAHGLAQLWAAIDGTEMKLALVTRLDQATRGLRCLIWHLGGHDRHSWLKFQDEIADWARAEGCIDMEAYARPGFLPDIHDWTPHKVIVRKAL